MRRSLKALSRAVSKAELWLACAMLCLMIVLLIVSVAMRATGAPLFWADEAMISIMGAMAALATSALVEQGSHAKVDLLAAFVSQELSVWLDRFAAFATLVFALVLVWLSWRLFDPLAMIQSGFDIDSFTAATRNFVYREPTTTLGIARFWTWLPLSIASLGMIIHALAWFFVPSRSADIATGEAAKGSAA